MSTTDESKATGTLRLSRTNSWFSAFVRFRVLIDGTPGELIANGQSLVIKVPAGEHRLRLRSQAMWFSQERSFDVAAGETVDFTSRAGFARPRLTRAN